MQRNIALCSIASLVTLFNVALCRVAIGQIVLPQLLSSPSPTESANGPVNKRIASAMIIAEQSAKNGLLDVSHEAVRRAFRNGPPIAVAEIRGLLNQSQPSRATSTRTVMTSINGVMVVQSINSSGPTTRTVDYSRQLLRLDEVWEAKSALPEDCYSLWRDLVLPKGRTQVFLYSGERDPPGEPKLAIDPVPPRPQGGSGACQLAKWAIAAGKADELRTILETWEPGADPTDILPVRAYLAIGENTTNDAVLRSLVDHAGMLPSARDANEKIRAASLLLEHLDYRSPLRREFYDKLTTAAGITGQPSQRIWLIHVLLAEATAALDQRDQTTLDACIDAVGRIVIPANSSQINPQASRQSAASELYASARIRALEKGHVGLALYCLSKSRSIMSSQVRILGDSSDLMATGSQTFQKLWDLPRADRYAMLKEVVWLLQDNSLSDLSTFAPTESIPTRFINAYKEKHQTDQLPIESVCGFGQSSLSLLEWYMRDGVALGHKREIEQELAAAEQQNRAAAKLARVVFSQAQNQPIDITPLIDHTGESATILPTITWEAGTPLPVHYDIARAAMSDDSTRSLGIEFAERLAERGMRLRNNIVLYGRLLAAQGKLASDTPPTSSEALRHFVRVDDFRYGTMVRGLPRESIWLGTEDGLWEHQASNTRSSLLLKYPLVGDFTMQFECQDGSFASCGATAMGLCFDFKAYSRMLGLDTVGLRKKDSRVAGGISSTSVFPVDIHRESSDGTVTVKSNEYELGKFKVEQESFPFFGAQSMMHRKMSLGDFHISGDYTIPRSVNLVTPRLWGWSSLFHVRDLPPLGSLSTAGAVSVKELSGGKGPASVKYEWEFDDGVLQSVDHQARYEADKLAGRNVERREHRSDEEWIYFGRPLCDGETVSFEFYHERGKYSVNPTIDRVAVQLGEQLKEHWISSDSNLFGLSGSDYFDLPSERIVGAVQLKEKEWNAAALTRAGDRITLSVNGDPILWQTVDTTFGGRFGLLSMPEQFHVRVRNVTLKGDWPDKLPEDLFELEK